MDNTASSAGGPHLVGLTWWASPGGSHFVGLTSWASPGEISPGELLIIDHRRTLRNTIRYCSHAIELGTFILSQILPTLALPMYLYKAFASRQTYARSFGMKSTMLRRAEQHQPNLILPSTTVFSEQYANHWWKNYLLSTMKARPLNLLKNLEAQSHVQITLCTRKSLIKNVSLRKSTMPFRFTSLSYW